MEGEKIHKAVMGKERESPILLKREVFGGFWFVFLNSLRKDHIFQEALFPFL